MVDGTDSGSPEAVGIRRGAFFPAGTALTARAPPFSEQAPMHLIFSAYVFRKKGEAQPGGAFGFAAADYYAAFSMGAFQIY